MGKKKYAGMREKHKIFIQKISLDQKNKNLLSSSLPSIFYTAISLLAEADSYQPSK
jgi:hypothetical protein